MNGLKWFVSQRQAHKANMNLFCFHHAGGAASFYKNWSAMLSPQVQVIAVQLPGREARHSEAFPTSLNEMVNDLVKYRALFAEKPYAIFGHSLGALFGFEVARKLCELGTPEPRFFVSSGHGVPGHGEPDEKIHTLPDMEFVQRMHEDYGGISEEVMESQELLQVLLPRFRADFYLADQHIYQHRSPVNFPLVAMHGRSDKSVSVDELAGWKKETAAQVEIVEFDGDHFFVESNQSEVLAVMNKLLTDQLSSTGTIHDSYS